MAENKKSFLMYCDWEAIFEQLDDTEAGILIKHIFKYTNDRNPSLTDRMLNIAFEPIKIQLKRDLKKWESEKDKKSDGGKLGNLKKWHPDLYIQVIEKQLNIDKAIAISKKRKLSHTDTNREIPSHSLAQLAVNVNVNDNVTVNDNVNVKDNNKIELTLEEKLKIHSPKEFPNWGIEVSKFLKDELFKKSFCSAKHIEYSDLEKKMSDFVVNLNLKQDYKDVPALKRHFTNYHKKHFENVKKIEGSKGFIEVPQNIDYEKEAKW